MAEQINVKIPGGSLEGYRVVADRAKRIYWEARSRDFSENWALKAVVDDMLRQQETE